MTLEIENYDIRKLIGHGGFGKVYRAIKKDTNEELALKIINNQSNLTMKL